MPSSDYTPLFLEYAAQSTKQILVAVEIEGVGDVLSSGQLNKKIRYGDPIVYGQPGIVYGGLIPFGGDRAYLQFENSSLTIQQKIEPEQGRASVTMMSLSFIDKDQYMTMLCAPGIVIPDLLGAQVVVRIGFAQISYPEDYPIIMRGRVSQYTSQSGAVVIQLSDPNMVRRQQIFYAAKTTAASAISAVDTNIPVVSVANFPQQVLGPNGTYDSAITTYVVLGNEIISYPPSGIDYAGNRLTGVTRGARGTVAASAAVGTQAQASIQVQDHVIDMALKICLSGWQGPYISDLSIANFVYTNDPITGNQPQGFSIGKDAVVDYGIAPGDTLTISGDTFAGNNGACKVVLFLETEGGQNRVIVTDKTFTPNALTTAVFSVRSQYDTYPDNMGLQMPGYEVDVARHQYIKNTFMSSIENSLRFYKDAPESSAKTFIESQIYLPFGCYSLTRFGRVSMQLTHAPIADQRLQILDKTNVLDPQNIKPLRGVNSRKFFNEIDLEYDYDDAGTPFSIIKFLDTNSLNIIGISSILPMKAEGMKSDLTGLTTINRTFNYILSRYKSGAVLITINVNFAIGIQIEAGDVVEINDAGFLQVSNFLTGKRNLGAQLYEVVDRTVNIVNGTISLQVVSGLGAEATDRFATFAPSTVLGAGTDINNLVLTDSFGTATPGQEYTKWVSYLGLRGLVHDVDWVQSATCVLQSLNPTNKNSIQVTGLGIAPSAGWILDLDNYSLSTDPLDQALAKTVHCFWDPVVVATSGISVTQFQVASSGIGRFQIGLPVLLHNTDFSVSSPEQNVLSVDTGTNIVTVSGSLGFTPSAGMLCELIGFPDAGGAYRFI